MMSRRDFFRRLMSTPAGLGLSLLAVSSLAGCGETPTPLAPLSGNRNDKDAQRDMEIPPGMPRAEKAGKKKAH